MFSSLLLRILVGGGRKRDILKEEQQRNAAVVFSIRKLKSLQKLLQKLPVIGLFHGLPTKS